MLAGNGVGYAPTCRSLPMSHHLSSRSVHERPLASTGQHCCPCKVDGVTSYLFQVRPQASRVERHNRCGTAELDGPANLRWVRLRIADDRLQTQVTFIAHVAYVVLSFHEQDFQVLYIGSW